MLNTIYFIKRHQKNKLVKEYYKLNNSYEEISEKRYESQNKFLKTKIFNNNRKNSISVIQKDLQTEYNKNKSLIFIRTKELDRLGVNDGLIPLFLTFTCPTEYHPFRKVKKGLYRLNPKFKKGTYENRINESYKFLKKTFRTYYKRLKKKYNKNLKYMRVFETHESGILHLHRILYIEPETFGKVYKRYNRLRRDFKLVETKLIKVKDTKTTSYLIKYLQKNYDDSSLKKFDGFKRKFKIRLFTMNNLELPLSVYKKLYYNNEELNNEIMNNIKLGKSEYDNLYHFYTMNTTIHEKIHIINYEAKGNIKSDKLIKKSYKKVYKTKLHNNNSIFNVYIEKKKTRTKKVFEKDVFELKSILNTNITLKNLHNSNIEFEKVNVWKDFDDNEILDINVKYKQYRRGKHTIYKTERTTIVKNIDKSIIYDSKDILVEDVYKYMYHKTLL